MLRVDPGRRLALKETAALAGVSEKRVRNEIEAGIVSTAAARKGDVSRREFPASAVYYFALVDALPAPLPAKERGDLYRLVTENLDRVGGWKRAPGGFEHAAGNVLFLRTKDVRKSCDARLRAYRRGLSRIERRPDVLGGEDVFRGTRIAVRHVGGLAEKGVPVEEILDDYPALSQSDVTFARIVAAMKPDPGRPPARLKFRKAAA